MKQLTLITLMICYSMFAQAQELAMEIPAYPGYFFVDDILSIGEVDACDQNKQVTFRVQSARPGEEYIRSDCHDVFDVGFKITCEIWDITTNQKVSHFFEPDNTQEYHRFCHASDFYHDYQELNDYHGHQSIFQLGTNNELMMKITATVKKDHEYRAHLVIEEQKSIGSLVVNTVTVADEWTNVIKIHASVSEYSDAWNRKIIQPSYTMLSQGAIAGNLSGNNEGYFIGTDGRIYNCAWSNNQWNIWAIQPSFTSAAPGGIAVNPSNGEVYFIGTDGRIYNCVWANNQWNIWAMQPSFTNAAPGSITVNPSNGEVYFIGTDGRIYNCAWTNNQWNIWAMQPSFTNAAPGAISVNPTNGEVYFIGTDGRIYNCVWANNQWNIWAMQPSFTNAAPGAISANSTNGEVYFIGNDGGIYNCVWANNQWNIWSMYPGYSSAAPGAIITHPQNGNVYFLDYAGTLNHAVWANNQWNIWTINTGYPNNLLGSIGIMQKVVGNKQYDMVLTSSQDNQLINNYWLGCLSQEGGEDGEDGMLANNNKNKITSAQMHQATNISKKILHSENTLEISPNPMIDQATVVYNISDKGNVSLGMYDIRGVKVKEYLKNKYHATGTYTLKIEKENLSGGLYYIIFENEKGEQKNKKVVIN